MYFPEIRKTKEYKKYKLEREQKMKSIKSGENVFHLFYFGGMITQSDLLEYEKSIKDIGSEFSSYDKNGDFYASLDSFTLDVCFILSQMTIQGIISNTINSATWDSIKYVVLNIWNKVKNKEIGKGNSSDFTKKTISFGIKVSLDKNTNFNFNLSGDLSEKIVLESLDKTLELIKSQKTNSKFKHPSFVTYDKKKGKWKSLDVDEEMRKIALKQIEKQKKDKE